MSVEDDGKVVGRDVCVYIDQSTQTGEIETKETTRIQTALNAVPVSTLKISEVAHSTETLEHLYRSIHEIVGELMPARNFYIALYDENSNELSFPYFVDEHDAYSLVANPRSPRRGLTEYVLRTGQPLLSTPEVFETLRQAGEVESYGTPSIDWLGVPLITYGKTIGVLAVQSYLQGVRYYEDDTSMLMFVSNQVAMAIERKQAEDALRKSEERYRSVIENLPIGVYRSTSGPHGQFLMANPAFLRMFGFKDYQELRGTSPADLCADPEEMQLFSRDLLRDKSVTCFELRLRKRDGTPIWGSVTAQVVHEEGDGNVLYFDCAITDITDRKQREQEKESIIAVAAALRAATSRVEMYPIILDQVIELLRVGGAALLLYDVSSQSFVVELARGKWSHGSGTTVSHRDSVFWQVLFSGKTCLYRKSEEKPSQWSLIPFDDFQSLICAPLNTQDQTIGIICAGSDQLIYDDEIQILSAISDMFANAIHRATLHEQTSRQVQRLAALRAVDMAINASMDLRVALNVLLNHLTMQLSVDASSILLVNHHMRTLEYSASRGFQTNAVSRSRVRLGMGPVGRAALDRHSVYIPDLNIGAPDFVRERMLGGESFVAYYSLPLTAKGQLLGLLEIFQRSPLKPDNEWIEFLETLAGQAAIAIDNATLFHGLQRSNMELALAYETTLEGWVHALDLRDKETEGHTKRVTEMTLKLARVMGMNENELVHIQRGALLHDIGKMAIPDSILQKPAKLDDEEMEIMRRHPCYAYDLLSPIVYLRQALDIPYCHHEKWDGSGYPRGLSGNQIPLAARIFAIVDVWDALRNERPYRKAWPEDQVIDYLREQANHHFDPEVVRVFMQLLQQTD